MMVNYRYIASDLTSNAYNYEQNGIVALGDALQREQQRQPRL
jgi:hypothetical protein